MPKAARRLLVGLIERTKHPGEKGMRRSFPDLYDNGPYLKDEDIVGLRPPVK